MKPVPHSDDLVPMRSVPHSSDLFIPKRSVPHSDLVPMKSVPRSDDLVSMKYVPHSDELFVPMKPAPQSDDLVPMKSSSFRRSLCPYKTRSSLRLSSRSYESCSSLR